jgi:hypothetical protein
MQQTHAYEMKMKMKNGCLRLVLIKPKCRLVDVTLTEPRKHSTQHHDLVGA